jgi:hypothetical protein
LPAQTEEAEMQARGERVNRDGDVVDRLPKKKPPSEAEAVFEESAEPDVEAVAADAEASEDAGAADDAEKPSA